MKIKVSDWLSKGKGERLFMLQDEAEKQHTKKSQSKD